MVCTEDFIVRHKSHISRSTLPRCRYEAWARTRVHIYNPGIRTYPMQRQGHDVAQLKTDGEMESTPLTFYGPCVEELGSCARFCLWTLALP
jgi:hypothetical protein